MKITFVLPHYADVPVGGYKVVYEYANHLVCNGHKATIVYLRDSRTPSVQASPRRSWLRRHLGQLAYKRGKPHITWYSLHSDVKLVKATDLEARRIPHADAIFATAWYTAASVHECPNENGAKFYLVQDFPPWLADQHELEQTWRLPLKKVCVSSWLAELVVKSGVPREDVETIPIAVDHARFHVTRSIRERAKMVVMLYSAVPFKRSQLGLSVLSKCKDVVPNLNVSLFGPQDQPLPTPPPWSDYYGYVSEGELIGLYNAASVYLCSSAAEGFALPPAEAMACGCAVATTDCGGNRDYAEHEKTALVSDPDDVSSLVGNVVRLLSDDELRISIARAGRDRIAQFTWENSTQQLIEFVGRYS